MTAELLIDGVSIWQSEQPSGHCDTPIGALEINYRPDHELGIYEAILDCSKAPTLQGKSGLQERRIQLGSDGVGQQTIGADRILEYRLGSNTRTVFPRSSRLRFPLSNGLRPVSRQALKAY